MARPALAPVWDNRRGQSLTLALSPAPQNSEASDMNIKVIVHAAEEGGFWAEVPTIPGCATQGDTIEELMRNLHEAIEGCLSQE